MGTAKRKQEGVESRPESDSKTGVRLGSGTMTATTQLVSIKTEKKSVDEISFLFSSFLFSFFLHCR